MSVTEELDIVIVGGGIYGLATALALHRKGIKSVVLERSETLRATGGAIGVLANGWRALQQLGLDSNLRSTAIPLERVVNVWLEKGRVQETPMSAGEARCLRRSDLLEALANALPLETIRFGCQVISLHIESSGSSAVLQLLDGSLIKAKILIGCDGANSVIANFLGLKPARSFSNIVIRGLTNYPDGHGYSPEILNLFKDKHLVGRVSIDEKLVYWFVDVQGYGYQRDGETLKDHAAIKEKALDLTSNFSDDIVDMIKKSDLSSLSLTHSRFRAPWNLLTGNFRREAVTVAGDAWHVMGPFLGQGGSTALEDAIVLARCLSKKMCITDSHGNGMHLSQQKAKEALDEYLKERRPRLLILSIRTYLTGLLLVGNTSFLLRFLCIIIMVVFFLDPLSHTRYNCGEL